MFLSTLEITPQSLVRDIVLQNHRTADVFRKYNIEYCCGGKWPLDTVCLMKGIDIAQLQKELNIATRKLELPSFLSFENWDIDFLIDYIINIHHKCLKTVLPDLKQQLDDFVAEHIIKHPELYQVKCAFERLCKAMPPHLEEEEQVIFPYIKQLAHAHENRDSYARLLVKTLRKPIGQLMDHEHEMVSNIIHQLRLLTNNYSPSQKACTNHYVIFSKLKELDTELLQHVYLENEILFPKALIMERDLLQEIE